MHVHTVSRLHGYPVLVMFNNTCFTDRDIRLREIQNLDPCRITGPETLGHYSMAFQVCFLQLEWLEDSGSLSICSSLFIIAEVCELALSPLSSICITPGEAQHVPWTPLYPLLSLGTKTVSGRAEGGMENIRKCGLL